MADFVCAKCGYTIEGVSEAPKRCPMCGRKELKKK
ncbi:MAG: rubredoxin-like domain-containing protein [Candidatus Bathyarchaeia archaeon]